MPTTTAEKELHKKAAELREIAYRARVKSRRLELEAAIASCEKSDVAIRYAQAQANLETQLDYCLEAQAAIRAQIAELTAQLSVLERKQAIQMAPFKQALIESQAQYRAMYDEVMDDIIAKYCDLSTHLRASDWKPIEAFMSQAQSTQS